MPARHLPARPNIAQYKKQAKELRDAYRSGDADASRRIREYVRGADALAAEKGEVVALADAQFVIAREHGFDSWPKFAKHIETLTIARDVEVLTDPVAAFFEAAGPPRAGHSSGTLERAEAIRARHPDRTKQHLRRSDDRRRGGRARFPRARLCTRCRQGRSIRLGRADLLVLLPLSASRCPQVGRIRPHGPGTPRRWSEYEHRLVQTIDTPPRRDH